VVVADVVDNGDRGTTLERGVGTAAIVEVEVAAKSV
jgi:hypothetical protein